MATTKRALARRCPNCGRSGIFDGYFELRESCLHRGVVFEREHGNFLGTFALNLIVAEVVGLTLAVLLLVHTELRHLDLIWQEAIADSIVVALPVLFLSLFARTVDGDRPRFSST